MASVFATPQQYAGSFRADQVYLVIGGEPVAGLTFQGINGNFAKQVTMLFELGSNNVYLIEGRGQGSASIAMILGPSSLQRKIIDLYRDPCNPRDLAFSTANSCTRANSGMGYILRKSVMNSINFSATANDVIANQNIGLIFVNLDQG